jgi:hypothetical protein
MNRTTYFCIAVALGFVGWFWSFGYTVLYVGNGLAKDSVPGASFYDGGYIIMLVIWSGIFLGIIWSAWFCLKRAFRPPPKVSSSSTPEPIQSDKASELATPDERLAHLVKKP